MGVGVCACVCKRDRHWPGDHAQPHWWHLPGVPGDDAAGSFDAMECVMGALGVCGWNEGNVIREGITVPRSSPTHA